MHVDAAKGERAHVQLVDAADQAVTELRRVKANGEQAVDGHEPVEIRDDKVLNLKQQQR